MTEFLFLLLGGLLGFFIGRALSSGGKELKMQMDTFAWQQNENTTKIKSEIEFLKKEIHLLPSYFLKESIDNKKVISKKEEKLPGANRSPRTEEQRRVAGEKKKAWWAAQRASSAKKEARDQMIPTPVETVPQLRPSLNPLS